MQYLLREHDYLFRSKTGSGNDLESLNWRTGRWEPYGRYDGEFPAPDVITLAKAKQIVAENRLPNVTYSL